jgi:hypothetical protein
VNELDRISRIFRISKRGRKETPSNRLFKNKYLYFIRCGDAVKIGVSSDPETRMQALSTGAPGKLYLLAKFPNSGNLENQCHKKLSHLRISGEWFRYTYEIDQLIRGLK